MLMNNEYKTIGAALKELEDDFKTSLPKNTGNLSNSVKTSLKQTENGFIIGYEMDYYGVYQDQGVSGLKRKYDTPFTFRDKMPPISAFSSYTSNLSEQFAIAKSIQTWGIKPKNFIKPAVDKAMELIKDYTDKDIIDYMREQIEKEKIFR